MSDEVDARPYRRTAPRFGPADGRNPERRFGAHTDGGDQPAGGAAGCGPGPAAGPAAGVEAPQRGLRAHRGGRPAVPESLRGLRFRATGGDQTAPVWRPERVFAPNRG